MSHILSKIYLTIDDSPSVHMDKKIDFLVSKNIPAVFYARGEYVSKHPDQIINAIDNGFLIGNHSYTHPYFSEISLEECIEEIARTEKLIDECYEAAGKLRPCKIVRFPFADRGAGPRAKEATSVIERHKVSKLQSFLLENHFQPLNFQSRDAYVDSYWDWDTEDYKTKYIQDPNLYTKQLEEFFKAYQKDTAVILLHDFDRNHDLFEASMAFLLERRVQFLAYQLPESPN